MSEVNCRYGNLSNILAVAHPSLAMQFAPHARWQESSIASTPALITGLTALGDMVSEYIDLGEQAYIDRRDNAVFISNDQVALACYLVDETAYGGLVAATEAVYDAMLAELAVKGYPHLVRVWNYFSAINEAPEGLERYRQFCDARFRAFERAAIAHHAYPSACALGHAGGHLLIYALASNVPPTHFENPRQVSAYHYPAQYGPRSPSFARATLIELATKTQLFVSGTASVVGHETVHPFALHDQLEETLANLSALMTHVESTLPAQSRLTPEILKVYLRHADDYSFVQQRLREVYPDTPCAYVMADVCRADLRLEIDGIWTLCQ